MEQISGRKPDIPLNNWSTKNKDNMKAPNHWQTIFVVKLIFKGKLPNLTKPYLQMYVKPENDIYSNRKITNPA